MPKPERILKTDLSEYGKRARTDGPYADNLDIDVLIVGAGFGGAYLLYEMRKQGYNTVLYDAGTSFGGTWRWVSFSRNGRIKYQLTWVLEHLPWRTSRQPGADLRIGNSRGLQRLDMDHELPRLDRTSSLLRSCRQSSGSQQGLRVPDSSHQRGI